MSESNKKLKPSRLGLTRQQRGVAAVEFAILAVLFFSILFGILEMARAVYLINTLQEVTRRAAAMAVNSSFEQTTIDHIREAALFHDVNGNLLWGDPITSAHLNIEYLSVSRDASTGELKLQATAPMPANPTINKINCLTDPYGASCIRFVRVRVCTPDGASNCTRVSYKMLFPLIDLSSLKLPRSTSIVPAQSLGFTFGSVPSP